MPTELIVIHNATNLSRLLSNIRDPCSERVPGVPGYSIRALCETLRKCYGRGLAERISLRFAWGITEAKCVLVTAVCVSVCPSQHSHTTKLHGPGCNLGNGRRCPLAVHYWANLQSLHGFRCYDNIAPNADVSECLYSLYAWFQIAS